MNAAGWITFLGVVITAVLGLVGAWSSSRANRRSSERATELESIKFQIQVRDQQIESWRSDAETLRHQREEDRERCAQEITDLRAQIAELVVRSKDE